jgi:predicted CxxxxCH...CXXCH cytochrome family protein
MRPFIWLLLLGAVAFAAGCSTANNTEGGGTSANHVLPSGGSVPGWTVPTGGSQHAISATQEYASGGTPVSCTDCHGAELKGGISRTSCFGNTSGCHHGTITGAITGEWVDVSPATQNHGVWAKRAIGDGSFFSCQICHGGDFSGGGALVSCFNNALCHGTGVLSPHPAQPWRGATYTHTSTNISNAPVCSQCHFPGSPNNPAGHPATPATAGTSPGCFNSTLCHGTDTVPHPVPYNDNSHYTMTSATFPGSCSTCHDVSAPSTKVGPVCQTCHVGASPLTALNCTSCHASPPSGAAYPNLAGAHSTHIALDNTGTPISCDTCHNGLGPSLLNLNHYNRAKSRVPPGDVAFLATYNAESGASSFSSAALSCSNVSCHGGPATPNWQTGAIDVNTQCSNCHALGTAQYNSYNSGEHEFHVVEQGLSCTLCHNTTTLAVDHFTTLADNAISPAVAAATIGSPFITAWTPGTGTSGTCNALCHPGDRNW